MFYRLSYSVCFIFLAINFWILAFGISNVTASHRMLETSQIHKVSNESLSIQSENTHTISDITEIDRELQMLLSSLPFERVISLGDHCVTKYQINFYFENKYPRCVSDYTGGSYIFDWVAVMSIKRLSDACFHKLNGVCDMNMSMEGGLHDCYDIFYPHLFYGHPIVADYWYPAGMNRLPVDINSFNKYYKDVQNKIEYKKNKFINNRHRTLYVFYIDGIDSLKDFSYENMKRLRDSLLFLRGDSNFLLNVVSRHNFGYENSENLCFSIINAPHSDEYRPQLYLHPEWEKMFDRFAYSAMPNSDHSLSLTPDPI